MSLRKHRKRAQGKKVRTRRMPRVDEKKMGTRIQQDKRLEDEDFEAPDLVRCEECGRWTEDEDDCDFEEVGPLCFSCFEQLRKERDDNGEAF